MSNDNFISIEDLWTHTGKYSPWLAVHLRKILGVDRLNALKRRVELQEDGAIRTTDPGIFARILSVLGVEYATSGPEFEWPKPGVPLLVVANHPMGGIEGIVLAAWILSKRPDARLMYTELLHRLVGVGETLLPISERTDAQGIAFNRKSMRTALKWLSAGGCVALFPGGDSLTKNLGGQVVETNWSEHASVLVRKTGAVVLPVCFELQPKSALPWMGAVGPKLRSLLRTARMAQQNKKLTIRFCTGRPVPFTLSKNWAEHAQLTDFLRLATRVWGDQLGMLKTRHKSGLAGWTEKWLLTPGAAEAPLALPIETAVIAGELTSLPPDALVYSEGNFRLFYVAAGDIPHTLLELGRLREYTFRLVGEGTGKCRDNDEFDSHYHHLVVWDQEKRQLAGAYRMGRAIPGQRRYVETLFEMAPPLLHRLHRALELGRSFILPEYQIHSGVLNMLWKGIAAVVIRNPDCPLLYGPVSMSSRFHPCTQALIYYYLKHNHFDLRNARFVRAPLPPRFPRRQMGVDLLPLAQGIKNIDQLTGLISTLEADGKGLPPLIKHYTRLGGRFIGFGVDRHFGNALDGLLLLDLRDTPLPLLKRYMGDAGARLIR